MVVVAVLVVVAFGRVRLRMSAAVLSRERHVVRAEHVEAGAQRRDRAHEVDGVADPRDAEALGGPRLPEDLVLRIETRRPRESGDRPAGREVRPARDRRVLREPAHLAHVLLVVAGEDHTAGSEEEARFEESVRHEVEDAGPVRSHSDADEHEAQLADGAVGEDLLDVVLKKADRGREGRGEHADHRHHRHGGRAEREEEVEPRHHVDAGGHHGGRVDQRRDGRRSGHRVRQPDVERQLRALSRRADEEEDADDCQHREAPERHALEALGHAGALVADLVAQLAEFDRRTHDGPAAADARGLRRITAHE